MSEGVDILDTYKWPAFPLAQHLLAHPLLNKHRPVFHIERQRMRQLSASLTISEPQN